MSISYQPREEWCAIATIELSDRFGDFPELVADSLMECRAEPFAKSPPGHAWFHILSDLSKGERRSARTAFALLTTLNELAVSGQLPGFRIVSGEHWLALPQSRPRIAPASLDSGSIYAS